MTTLRSLIVLARALPQHCIGGMQTVAWDLATELVRQDIKVTVLTAEIPGRPVCFEEQGVRVRALTGTPWHRYGHNWRLATRTVFQQELLAHCDLVLSVSAGGFGLLPLRERIPTVPFVLQAHGTSIREIASKWRTGRPKAIATSIRNAAWVPRDLAAYRHFDAIVAVGDRVAADFKMWPVNRLVDRRLIKVIRNGIDTVRFRPDMNSRRRLRAEFGWSDELKVIISVGRLHKQKGLAYALEGFALLARRHPNVRYAIVGEGPELRALKQHAERLGIGPYVCFCGSVPRELIPSYLNAADVMLFTTTHAEGEPLNVLEALAVGLPVVASGHLYPHGVPSEHILAVAPSDATAVVTALQTALEFPRSRQSVLPVGYTMTESVRAYLDLFEHLLHAHGE